MPDPAEEGAPLRPTPNPERDGREARALRANLRRRKQQALARQALVAPEPDASDPDPAAITD